MKRAAALVAVLALHAAPAAASPLKWGCSLPSYCNQHVPTDGVLPLEAWPERGDFLGFRRDLDNSPPPSEYSGIERLATAGGRYLIVTRARSQDVQFDVVELASRRTGDVRFGSNRRGPDPQAVLPPDRDRTLFSVFQDPGFTRTGAPSALGDLLAVPIYNDAKQSRIALYDISDPLDPVRYGSLTPSSGVVKPASMVALTQLAGGRYLMILGRAGDKHTGLDFYEAPSGRRPSAWTRRSSWKVDDPPYGWGFSSIHIVGRADALTLLGSAQRDGKDAIDTYFLGGTTQDPKVRQRSGHNIFRCRDAEVEQCNFNAGASVFMTPTGTPLVYSIQKRGNTAKTFTRFEEFHFDPPNSRCDRSTAYVELFDGNIRSRSLLIDAFDLPDGAPDLAQQSGFDNRASGGAWCLAPGDRARLYEERNPCGGGYVDLMGTGKLLVDPHFADTDGVVTRFDNKASCVQFVYDPAAPTPTPVATTAPTSAPTPTPTPDLRADLVISAASKTRFTVTNQGRTNAPAFKVLVQSAGTFAFTGLAAGASATKSFSTGTCLDTRAFTADSGKTVDESDEGNNVTVYPEHCAQDPGL